MNYEKNSERWRTVCMVLALLLVLALLVVAVKGFWPAVVPEEPVARSSYNTACYREQGGDKWVCGDGGEMEFQSGATLDLQSGATVSSDAAVDLNSTLNVDGATTLAGLLYPSFADETITDGETLTPTVTVYALDSAGAVTLTLAASATEGQLLILIGDDANNITINDTNVRTNDGGVQVIGQYDVIIWVYQDSEWIEISESNNS